MFSKFFIIIIMEGATADSLLWTVRHNMYQTWYMFYCDKTSTLIYEGDFLSVISILKSIRSENL